MKNTILLSLSVAASLTAGLPDRPDFGLRKFTSVVIFGDSYTDQGVARYRPVNGTVAQPKTINASGGRVWPQYVKQYSGANVYDYAVSGAICTKVFSPLDRNGVKEQQVVEYLTDDTYRDPSTGKKALNNPDDETVYAIWIGTNDLGNRAFFTDIQPRGLSITAYTDCVFEQLDRLHRAGARHFVILNVAPLQLTPQYAPPELGGVNATQFFADKIQYNPNITQSTEKIRQYTTLVNEVYRFQTPYQVKIANRYPRSSFALFDVHSLLTDMYKNPATYLNGTAPLNVTSSVVQCGGSCNATAVRDSYLWYDTLHPSEQTERIIAREFLGVVKGSSKWADYWSS